MRTKRIAIWAVLASVALAAFGVSAPALAASDTKGDAAFTYAGTWQSNPGTEHFTTAVGASATAVVDVAAGGGTVTFSGVSWTGDGYATVQVDSASPVLADQYFNVPCCTVRTWLTTPVLAAGRHTFVLSVSGQRNPAATDQYLSLTGVAVDNGAIVLPPPPVPPAPDAGGSGVPAGTALTVLSGDQTITTAGTVIDGKDIHGRVIVKAANVTIRNSIIRGLDGGSINGLLDNMSGSTGLKVYDSEVVATVPSMNVNGVMGWNLELHRVNVHGVIDGLDVAGSNVVVDASWIHNLLHYTNDPNHSDGVTHDDNIQVTVGTNIQVTGSVLTGAYNAALMLGQDRGPIGNVTVANDRLDGGGCTINIAPKTYGPLQGVTIRDNTFGLNTRLVRCGIIAPSTQPLTLSNNLYTDGTAVVRKNG